MNCHRCGRAIARADDQTEVLGRHEHDVTNPHGHRFRIGCFSAAENLVSTTNPSSEWSWFPGTRWQAQACSTCGELVGWKFVRGEGEVFYGLIISEP